MTTRHAGPYYFAIGEDEFRTLVGGGIVELTTNSGVRLRLILSDIGLGAMADMIAEAQHNADVIYQSEHKTT